MANYDYRTKPDTEWTFFVVDHLPTMSNFYWYDTAKEAIEKYASLPANQRSAIGSSLGDKHVIDHIHRIDGKSVLQVDFAKNQEFIRRVLYGK